METSNRRTHVKRIFLRFLKEYNVLIDFKSNIGNWGGRPVTKVRAKNFYQLVHELPPKAWIDLAFAWENSKLGWHMWEHLYEKWKEIIDYLDKNEHRFQRN